MCLFITVTPCTADFNRTQVKRVLKGASVLSAFLEDRGDHCLYYLANDRHCACDLRESGPDPDTGTLRLKQAALSIFKLFQQDALFKHVKLRRTISPQLFTDCLFIRLVEDCQAAVLLASRGFEQSVAVLTRVAIEALLKLIIGLKDPAFFNV